MAAFIPGASPPLVRTATRFIGTLANLRACFHVSISNGAGGHGPRTGIDPGVILEKRLKN
jgi:hypothetical protein